MEFTIKEKKKLNEFVDKYEYLLEEGDYVTFLKEYREQNKNARDALYYAFVDLIEETFGLSIEWFIKNDPDFYWADYIDESSSIPHINIPAGVTTIPKSAFFYCSSLTSITIPDSVTTINSSAFYSCSNLTTVTISENSQLTTIENFAFKGCSSLTSIYIPDSVIAMKTDAFYECSSLTSINIPNSVITIGDNAFYNCSSLNSIFIPNSVTAIGSYAFYGCSNLTIYCEASSRPSGWASSWNSSNRPVVWGYKKK